MWAIGCGLFWSVSNLSKTIRAKSRLFDTPSPSSALKKILTAVTAGVLLEIIVEAFSSQTPEKSA
jgi:hypothetical protein